MRSKRDDTWTGEFAKKKLETHSKVASVELLGPQLLRIRRTEDEAVVVATMAAERVDAKRYEAAIEASDPSPNFVVNIPAESVILGDAIRLAQRQGVGLGQFKDLMAALLVSDVTEYLPSDLRFIERGLRRHDRVKGFERSADRQYLITRDSLPLVRAVFLDVYDLTADHVREARARYGSFQAVVKTNPNGHATTEAETVAAGLRCRVYTWRAFYGALNKKQV